MVDVQNEGVVVGTVVPEVVVVTAAALVAAVVSGVAAAEDFSQNVPKSFPVHFKKGAPDQL